MQVPLGHYKLIFTVQAALIVVPTTAIAFVLGFLCMLYLILGVGSLIFHPSLEYLWYFFATMLSAVASVGLLSSVISIGVRYLGNGVSGLKSATPLEWAAMLLGGMVFPSWCVASRLDGDHSSFADGAVFFLPTVPLYLPALHLAIVRLLHARCRSAA